MRSKFSAFVFVLSVLAFAMPALAAQRHPRPRYYGDGYQGSQLKLLMNNNASLVDGLTLDARRNGYRWDNRGYGYDYRYDSYARRYRHDNSLSSWLNLAATAVVGGIEIHKQNQTNERLDRLSRDLQARSTERPDSRYERPAADNRASSVTVVNHTGEDLTIFGTKVPAGGGLEIPMSTDELEAIISDDSSCRVHAKHTSGVIELTCW